MPAAVAPSLAELFIPASLLETSETGIIHFRPLYAPGDPTRLVDFSFLRLNPAAQRLLGLPEFPTGSFLALRPGDKATLQFYHTAYLASEAGYHNLSTLPGWRARAQRQGPQLVVSLTPTTLATGELPSQAAAKRAATDGALARALQATRQLTQERETLRRVLAQTPAAICLLRGPEYRFEYVNPAFAQLFANRALEGLPAAGVLPEALNQGFIALLDRVYDTGETFLEAEVRLESQADYPQYFNFTYQAHLEDGHADRLSVFAYNATEQVAARQQVQHLNEELHATNAELRANNTALTHTQHQLQQLNEELEARVVAGIGEAQQAHAHAEQQRQRLLRFFEQAPVAICVLDGPELVYELINPIYQRYFLGRPLLGQPVAAVPELVEQHIPALLRQVYETGLTHEGHEVRLLLPTAAAEPPQEVYFNCVYQARHNEHGQVDGVLVFAYDVTEQVRARQLTHLLHQGLEARVTKRTQQLQAALQETEKQYSLLRQAVAHTQALVALVRGPEHRFEYVSPAFEQLFSGLPLPGRPLAEALPKTVAQGFVEQLERVYRTGETAGTPEVPLTIAQFEDRLARTIYLDLTYQAHQEAGQTVGVWMLAFDVSERVRIR